MEQEQSENMPQQLNLRAIVIGNTNLQKPSISLIKYIITGATGATGKKLIPILLDSPHYSKITILGRREYVLPSEHSSKGSIHVAFNVMVTY